MKMRLGLLVGTEIIKGYEHRACHHRSHDRRHSPAFDFEAGLSSRSMVTTGPI
jgi:hypothetical protein